MGERDREKILAGYSRPLLDNSSVLLQNKVWPIPQSSRVQDMVGIIFVFGKFAKLKLPVAYHGHYEFSDEADRRNPLPKVDFYL